MMTLSKLHKHQKSKPPKKREVIDQPIAPLSIATMPGRGRSNVVVEEAQPEPKILTIHDLPRRRLVTLDPTLIRSVRSRSSRGRASGLFAEWEPEEYCGPKWFSDYMGNGAWKGRRCFIIGGGPSIKKLDPELLKGELTIGINRAYELLSPSILYGVDSQLFGWAELGKLGAESRRKFNEFSGFKVWMALHKLFPDDICLIEVDNRDGHRIGNTRKLAFKNNSGYGAINLAAALGANPIYLLGFDMHGDGQGNQKNWHDGYPVSYSDNVYKGYIEQLNGFAPVLKDAGFRVVNLNRKSALKCFEFGTLRNVVAKRKAIKHTMEPWVLVSFYTSGTGYEQEVKKLEASVIKHSIPYHFFACHPMGSWRRNLNYKSEMILKAFDMFPGQDIVFVDSDAVIQKYPKLFNELSQKRQHTMAAHFHEYTTSVKGGSLLSGTLWFANNEKSKQLVSRWHKIGKASPTVRHQHCLNIALNELRKEGNGNKVFRLPPTYTQIFDYKGNKHKDAVIEHFQASRRLRTQVGKGGPLADSSSFARKGAS